MTDFDIIIGLEVHAEVVTQSKMFCGCANEPFGAAPNTHVCPICLGMPGTLPVINQRAVEATVMTGLALNCHVPQYSKWDRKNYPYPDLPKGYQISQYDLPLTRDGWLEIESEGGPKRIGIRRVHLEEDTAKLFHVDGASLIDFNRAGVPLMEIVSEPDIRTVEEARLYALKLRQILRYLGVNSGDMEKGAIRFEANISMRPRGQVELPNYRVEVKNLNSFRAVLRSLEYEIERQAAILRAGGQVRQETMDWNEERGVTASRRSKEEAHDYRYFPEPDLPPLMISRSWVDELRAGIPELPDTRRTRFVVEYGLPANDADVLTAERAVADYFEAAARAGEGVDPKAIANFVTGEMFRLMKAQETDIADVKVPPDAVPELVQLVERGQISISVAKTVFEEMFNTGQRAPQIVAARGLERIGDEDRLAGVIDAVIGDNPRAVADYRAGKEQALKFLVGQVMRATRGQADAAVAQRLLSERLKTTTDDR